MRATLPSGETTPLRSGYTRQACQIELAEFVWAPHHYVVSYRGRYVGVSVFLTVYTCSGPGNRRLRTSAA
jgi:hypothetical protein